MTKEMKKQTIVPGVTIIICCHNSAKLLPQTLAHLKTQKVSTNIPWEVIVVDNASTDETSKISLSSWLKDTSALLRVVQEPQLGLSYARRKGFSEAKYEFCSFVDDDNWVNPSWIKIVYEIMNNHPEVGACGGLNETICEIKPPEWFESYKLSYGIGSQGDASGYVPKERGFLWGAGLVVRKSAWKHLVDNGFYNVLTGRKGKQILSGEDEELTLALQMANWKLWYEPRLRLKHYLPAKRLNWKALCRLHRSFGASQVVFDIYKHFIGSEVKTPRKSWIWLCLQSAKMLLHSYIIFIIKRFIFHRKDNGGITSIEQLLGRFLKYLQINWKYNQIYDSINSLSDNLKNQ